MLKGLHINRLGTCVGESGQEWKRVSEIGPSCKDVSDKVDMSESH